MSTSKFRHDEQPSIGILGTGRMGVRLAAMFARAGRKTILGSRDPARVQRIVDGLNLPSLSAGSYTEAAAARAVLPAIFIRDGLFDLLEQFRESLSDKLVIDITNPFNEDYSDFILPWDTSGAEELQKRFRRAYIVGAFKNVWWEVFDAPHFAEGVSDVFVTSDHDAAKREFLALTEGTPFRYIDSGALKNSRTVERMTLMMGELGQRYGYHPRMSWRMLGERRAARAPETVRIDRLVAR